MKSYINNLIEHMKNNPRHYILDEHPYCLINRYSCLEIWIANGFWFYGIYEPHKIKFTFFDKIRFHKAYKQWQKDITIILTNKLGEINE